jgi:hypothetical protein
MSSIRTQDRSAPGGLDVFPLQRCKNLHSGRARAPRRRRLSQLDFELIPHFGGEVVQQEESLGGFVGEFGNLQDQVAVQQHGRQNHGLFMAKALPIALLLKIGA